MSSHAIRRETSRQRFTFTLCGEFPRERELLAHLFKLPNGRTGAAALQMIMLGLETAGRATQVELDDNFPWMAAQADSHCEDSEAIDSMSNLSFKCQFSLYPHIAEHSNLMAMMARLSGERRADVLRRLSLRGIRIHALGRKLAMQSPQSGSFLPTVNRPAVNLETLDSKEISKPPVFKAEAQRVFKEKIINTDESSIVKEHPKTRQKSIEEETVKPTAKTQQPGDNEKRVRTLFFRKSPEFSAPDENDSSPSQSAERKEDSADQSMVKIAAKENEIKDTEKDQDNAGVVILMGTPMQEKQNDQNSKAERNGLAGLAAMMGGFAGMAGEE